MSIGEQAVALIELLREGGFHDLANRMERDHDAFQAALDKLLLTSLEARALARQALG